MALVTLAALSEACRLHAKTPIDLSLLEGLFITPPVDKVGSVEPATAVIEAFESSDRDLAFAARLVHTVRSLEQKVVPVSAHDVYLIGQANDDESMARFEEADIEACLDGLARMGVCVRDGARFMSVGSAATAARRLRSLADRLELPERPSGDLSSG